MSDIDQCDEEITPESWAAHEPIERRPSNASFDTANTSARAGEYDAERAEWKAKVDAVLASPLGNDIPTDHVIALLECEDFGPWMEQIENAKNGATLVVPNVADLDDDGRVNEMVVVRLEHSSEDPFEWIEREEFSCCPMSYTSVVEELVQSALGVCQHAYWANSTDNPTAMTMRVLWPLGHGATDWMDADRVELPDGAFPSGIVEKTEI